MILPITLTIAAALALLNVGLAIRIVQLRFAAKTLIGTGGDAALETRMRAQANLVEYAPFFLILLALVELAGASPTWVWIAGVAFVVARLAHAVGMDGRANAPRAIGAVATWALLLLMAGWALATAYQSRAPGGAVIVAPSASRA